MDETETTQGSNQVVDQGRARLHPQVALWLSRGFLGAVVIGGGTLTYGHYSKTPGDLEIAAPAAPQIATVTAGVMPAVLSGAAQAAAKAPTEAPPAVQQPLLDQNSKAANSARNSQSADEAGGSATATGKTANQQDGAKPVRHVRSGNSAHYHVVRPVRTAVRGVKRAVRAASGALGRLF